MDFNIINSGYSYGELDPKLFARTDFVAYNRGCRTANNVLSIPQGGFTSRFGTSYVAALTATNKDYAKLHAFVFDNKTVYNLAFEHNVVNIYLENTLQASVVTTYPAEIVKKLNFVTVEDRLVILHQNFAPAQLERAAVAPNIITGVTALDDTFTITNALVVDNVYPATFTTAGTLPVSDPQTYINTTYFVRAITANTVRIYNTPGDASDNVNQFNVTATGTGNLILRNTWTLSAITFSTMPAYDFDSWATYSVDAFRFSASAVSGTVDAPLTLTANAVVFTPAMVGGLFEGNGGLMRIVADAGTGLTCTGYTYESFDTAGVTFPGKESFLGEPAWSAAHGYPTCGSFFQGRLYFGGSRDIPHGIWGSTVNSVYDFNSAQVLDDSAISSYLAAGLSNNVKAMTSTKSLVVHTHTGNYSTPLTSEAALTPKTFSLTEQNKDGISDVVPIFVDNQIIYVDKSANNVKSMNWDISQSSYINTNISLISSHLINSPVDMDVYREPSTTDGYYAICINADGKLGIYNSLIEQDIKGWTKAGTKQNATEGYFRDISAGLDKAWVIVERTIGGTAALYIEELDFNVRTDSSMSFVNAVATNVLTGLNHLIGETVQVVGDGNVLADVVVAAGGTVTLDVTVTNAIVGLQFISTITPLPVNVQMKNGPSLYQAVHIRNVYVHYYESIGMKLRGFDIPTIDLQDVVLGETPVPATDVYEYNLMEGWNSFDKRFSLDIVQEYPLPMTLLAVGYSVEV